MAAGASRRPAPPALIKDGRAAPPGPPRAPCPHPTWRPRPAPLPGGREAGAAMSSAGASRRAARAALPEAGAGPLLTTWRPRAPPREEEAEGAAAAGGRSSLIHRTQRAAFPPSRLPPPRRPPRPLPGAMSFFRRKGRGAAGGRPPGSSPARLPGPGPAAPGTAAGPREDARALRSGLPANDVKGKEQEKTTDVKAIKTPVPVHSPQRSTRNHALLEAAGPSHVAINAISANMDSFSSSRTAALKKQPSHMEAAHFGDLGRSCLNYQAQETKSSLSKTLEQVLQDSVALPYFIQFMELRRMEHLVKFWLEAESFHSTTWSRIRAHSLNTVKQSSLAEPVSPSKQQELASSPPAAWLEERLEGPGPEPDRTASGQNRAGPPGREPRSKAEPGTRSLPADQQESSKLSVSNRNSPSSALKDLSGKLMKSIERDAVSTFTKYISPDAAKPIPITEAMRNDIVAKICGEDGQVDPNCFVTAQSIVFNAMEQEHFSEFLRSHHFCKYQIEVLTSGTVYLADILFCESALFYFSEYMEKEDAVNVLQFWLAADNFQSQLAAKEGQYDGQEAQNDAMILYDKYFSLQATHPLGFDDSVRLEIESNICREGGPLPNCFTTPLRQAWTTMETVFLPGFLSSNLYYKYLNDLIHSVRGDEFPGGNIALSIHGPGSSPDSDSIGSTDGSAPQSNVKKANVKILKNFDEAIIVDAASLDPESLYQRTYAGKMTFGRVSDLGQFIRESEPEPDVKKSKGSMFSQAMKKWVQGNTDEAQEEMAWRIAKMIVNDVMQQAQCEQPLEKVTKVGGWKGCCLHLAPARLWEEQSSHLPSSCG
ncbi:A-kinase anchor protein 10, mitochondrial isoform X1 [Motacilla alba alba]|uniref:A-kinase anchor protein 10, mitochondrial isoform X1 n=1 Tax=Motacilla alba alba TaxID=1094192 RepID=UPI0018D56918|nr:A-kinase anchor protein 10, mitochondrial isoform X1 [Motacilla alba alba]